MPWVDGDITLGTNILYPEGQGQRVIEVASRAASKVAKLLPKEKWRSEDKDFVDLVSRIDHELMDDPDY